MPAFSCQLKSFQSRRESFALLSCLILLVVAAITGCNKYQAPANAPVKPIPQVVIDPSEVVSTIDRLTYGSNQQLIPEVPFRRVGGNRMTGYNWEINSSHAGVDYKNVNDRWLNTQIGLDPSNSHPAGWILASVAQHKSDSADSLVTIPLAGYVAADATGKSVSRGEAAPSKRWVKAQARKPNQQFGSLDLRDKSVFVDEEVAWLVSKLGASNAGGIRYYALDNEPSLWSATHPRLHPKKTTYKELTSRTTAAAEAVLSVDPNAEIVGPSLYGWYGHQVLQDAPDAKTFNKEHGNFSAYYLSQMRKASEQKGKRLLHIFDFHWYPEAEGGGTRIARGEGESQTKPAVVEARLQAPRSLWDPTYVEDSWIASGIGNQPIQLIPRMQKIIDENYPDTRLGILEYNYGAGHHVSGGLATADVLGIFGRYGVAACLWVEQEHNEFEKTAFRLYLNYDGRGASFQKLALNVPVGAPQLESIYAARSEDSKTFTFVVINKQPSSVLSKKIQLKDTQAQGALRAFRFGPGTTKILPVADEQLRPVEGGFEIKCPPHTATMIELKY